jgi:DNA-binding transcriptional MerR regulator
MTTYTTTQAASRLQAIGITPSTIRNYCKDARFQKFLSPGATPPAGQTRRLSDDDLQAFAFIHQQSINGAQLDEIAQRMKEAKDAGQPLPIERPEQPQDAQQPGAALVLASAVAGELAQYRTTTAGLTAALFEAGRTIARAEARNAVQEERVADLQVQVERLEVMLSDREELQRLQAQLAEAQQPVSFLARLLGRR